MYVCCNSILKKYVTIHVALLEGTASWTTVY